MVKVRTKTKNTGILKEYDDHIKGIPQAIAGDQIIKKLIENNFLYSVVFFSEEEKKIYHICGYESKPNLEDLGQLYKELRTDDDFYIPEDVLNNLDVDLLRTEKIEDRYSGYDF